MNRGKKRKRDREKRGRKREKEKGGYTMGRSKVGCSSFIFLEDRSRGSLLFPDLSF